MNNNLKENLIKFNEIATNQGFITGNVKSVNLVLTGKIKHDDKNDSFKKYDIKILYETR